MFERKPVWGIAILCLLSSVAASAQHSPGGFDGDGDPPPIDENPSCRYTVVPVLGPLSSDRRRVADDFCNAAASLMVYVGETDADYNSLASSAASSVNWRCDHHAVTAGHNPCAPVEFSDHVMLHAKVEARLTGIFGARHAQSAGTQSLWSTVLPPVVCTVHAACNDAGITATYAAPIPVPGPTGPILVPTMLSLPVPAAAAASSATQRQVVDGRKTTEFNYVNGNCHHQISAGGTNLLGGGGRARVTFSEAEFSTASRCDVHGVLLTFAPYSDVWRSTLTSGF